MKRTKPSNKSIVYLVHIKSKHAMTTLIQALRRISNNKSTTYYGTIMGVKYATKKKSDD